MSSNFVTTIHSGGKWGFIDKQGRVLVPLTYDGVQEFSEGFAAVNEGAYVKPIEPKGFIGFGGLAYE